MPSKYLSKLQGKSVLVVGGSSGIGYGIAEAALESNATVVIASRSLARVNAAVEALQKSYPEQAARIRGYTVDLDAQKADTEKELISLFEFATDKGTQKLDHVVETAGDLALAGILTLESANPELIAEAASVRLTGVVLLAKVAARYLKAEYTSSFTLTSGTMMYRPRKGYSPLLAAAGGKEPLTRGLALDMAPIRVNMVSPGAIGTEILYNNPPPGWSKESLEEMYSKDSILGRVGDVEDVVEAYLAIMKSGFWTASTVHVEGGALLM
jgi:NAD(P)-dependent dehydrogenase (short-subunit alcohol dehydrogenase family)